jgi:hypothetical protein
MQMRFNPEDIQHKTMKILDRGQHRAARLAMLPDNEIFCVDLTEGISLHISCVVI